MSMRSQYSTADVPRLARGFGAAKVVGHFSGGNDEGGYDHFDLFADDGTKIDSSEIGWDSPLASAMYGHLSQWGSFAGEFSVHGTVTVDVATGKVDRDYEESSFNEFHDSY
jgi:hypothetical protein